MTLTPQLVLGVVTILAISVLAALNVVDGEVAVGVIVGAGGGGALGVSHERTARSG